MGPCEQFSRSIFVSIVLKKKLFVLAEYLSVHCFHSCLRPVYDDSCCVLFVKKRPTVSFPRQLNFPPFMV